MILTNGFSWVVVVIRVAPVPELVSSAIVEEENMVVVVVSVLGASNKSNMSRFFGGSTALLLSSDIKSGTFESTSKKSAKLCSGVGDGECIKVGLGVLVACNKARMKSRNEKRRD